MNQIINMLKEINYQIPKELLFNYKKIGITDSELILLIYLINNQNNIYNPKQIANDLEYKLNEVLEIINSLSEKSIVKVEVKKNNNVRSEFINLDYLYEKIAFSLSQSDTKANEDLYSMFETEFGRTLSPMEYEIISGWLDNGYSEEIIKLALKEAIYNGVNSLRYIDKIIYEWNKKGIKTKEDVEKNRKSFKNNSTKNKELFEYDWLNERNN